MDLIRKALGRQAPGDDASSDTGRDLATGEQDQAAAQSSDPITWHEEMVVKGSSGAGVQPVDPDGLANVGEVDPLGLSWQYQILPDMEPDEPDSGPADLAPDAEADTDKLEAYDYPGEYAQRFDSIDKSAGGGDGQPDLIVGTATGGATVGQGSGGMADGSVRHIGDNISGSTWASDDAGDDGPVALADRGAESPRSAGEPGGIAAEDDWETPIATTDDGGSRAEAGVAVEDDDEPLLLTDLTSEGSRPLSDSAPVAEDVPDVPEADEMPELDETDV